MGCIPAATAAYDRRLMWPKERHHYEWVQRMVKNVTGDSHCWIGLDSRDRLGNEWESSYGKIIDDPHWLDGLVVNNESEQCGKINGELGG